MSNKWNWFHLPCLDLGNTTCNFVYLNSCCSSFWLTYLEVVMERKGTRLLVQALFHPARNMYYAAAAAAAA
ncbi:Uncharacterized protein TCM_024868 [Theobroma cacao]|uniref:Uncharacterized protein n=1 Tax=Theobroma cacao TaxID=3641 RepID=A0A061EXB8_THECC|nr:Uncharacterized protein TCM_024868 [Theobroma cacao]